MTSPQQFVPDDKALAQIPGLRRFENFSKEEFMSELMELTHSVYPHAQVYGTFCTVEEYINCPPEKVFEYMSQTRALEEWTYSTRGLRPSEIPGVEVGYDRIGGDIGGETQIYCKTVSNREAGTVDYHCAWDQGRELWMIYLNRIVSAERVLGKPGSIVLWTNCRHPHYFKNPHPELMSNRPVWVGEYWDWFYAGHWMELQNLKTILEYRHSHGLPVGPLFTDKTNGH